MKIYNQHLIYGITGNGTNVPIKNNQFLIICDEIDGDLQRFVANKKTTCVLIL